MAKAYALDLDGTLAWGDPVGPITRDHLLMLQAMGYVIGSSSGKTADEVLPKWRANGFEPAFFIHKDELAKLKPDYDEITHVGDLPHDVRAAQQAGVNYMTPQEFVAWIEGEKSA